MLVAIADLGSFHLENVAYSVSFIHTERPYRAL